jgi:hypothetical protein
MPADEPALPQDVLLALRQDQHAEAVKRLQAHRGISAQEAEARIDRYLEENPPVPLRGPGIVALNKLNALIWLALIVMMGLVYLLLVG